MHTLIVIAILALAVTARSSSIRSHERTPEAE